VLDLLNALDLHGLLGPVFGDKQTGVILLTMACLGVVLRVITTTPIGKKEP
jgi:hypothetical protein